jgi:DNA/RNA endonuclease YhcR with UshA esterase domain
MTVVCDLQACPELGAINPRALKGQTIRAKGTYQTYDGKPQVKVVKADNLTIDPKPTEKKGS